MEIETDESLEEFLLQATIGTSEPKSKDNLDFPLSVNYHFHTKTGFAFEKFGEKFLNTCHPYSINVQIDSSKTLQIREVLIERGFLVLGEETHITNKGKESFDGVLLEQIVENGPIYCFINRAQPFNFEDDLSFVYAEQELRKIVLDHIVSLKEFLKKTVEKDVPQIYLVFRASFGLQVRSFDIKFPQVNVELHYSKDFKEKHDKIVGRLNGDLKKGLFLFSGDPGTGKTNYIRHLTSLVDRKFIFIPPFMVDSLSGPDLLTLLISYPESVLVIEDAEKAIMKRDQFSHDSAVSTILNLADGFLSDVLNSSLILTFNCKENEIDEALLRKGRLAFSHRFEKLSVDELEKLSKSEGKSVMFNESLSLAEYYNLEHDTGFKKKQETRIGFI